MKPSDRSSVPVPISIPEDIATRCDGPDQFEKFDALFRTVISHAESGDR